MVEEYEIPQWPSTVTTDWTYSPGEFPMYIAWILTKVAKQMYRVGVSITDYDLDVNRNHLNELIDNKVDCAFQSLKDLIETKHE